MEQGNKYENKVNIVILYIFDGIMIILIFSYDEILYKQCDMNKLKNT